MKEPFKSIERNEHEEVPSFSATKLVGCYFSSHKNMTDPEPITNELNDIFDKGNNVHWEDEVLNIGSKRVISCEEYIKALHESGLFAISGFHDYLKMDFRGPYLEDLKSTKRGGFYFFLQDGINEQQRNQLSFYAYLYYIKTGVFLNKGVITKINKENTRERISLETNLFTPESMRNFVEEHPLILYTIGEISTKEFYAACIKKILKLDSEYRTG